MKFYNGKHDFTDKDGIIDIEIRIVNLAKLDNFIKISK